MAAGDFYDAVVIGGGPAGATAARCLAKEGLKVCLVEKRRLPRFKLCAGLITQKTVRLLSEIFKASPADLESRGILHHQKHRYAIFNTRTCLVQGVCETPFRFVDRPLYDRFCVERAGAAGAEILVNEKVVAVHIASGQVSTSGGKRLRARFILGADGVFSITRKALARAGCLSGSGLAHIALSLEAFVRQRRAAGLVPDFPALYFGYNRWGYAWSFPGRKDRILGMCVLKTKGRPTLKSAFHRFLGAKGIFRSDIRAMKGYALPYGNYLLRPGSGNILLLGDAAGFADPLLGEGIFYAHKSGALAARALFEAFDTPGQAARLYADHLAETVLVEMRWAAFWRRIVHTLGRISDYRFLGMLVRMLSREMEETVHGKRTFRGLRPLERA